MANKFKGIRKIVGASKRCSYYGNCLQVILNTETNELSFEEFPSRGSYVVTSEPDITLFYINEPTTMAKLLKMIEYRLDEIKVTEEMIEEFNKEYELE